MHKLLILITGLSGLLISAASDARPPNDGRCADYDFSPWTENGEIDTNNFVRVLRLMVLLSSPILSVTAIS